ncbi:MAG: PEP-CTERM system TPR-repeat protein PrsT [Burkholderiaceae bacterium]|nr:MAG: PEP-CTERM system TPR-repeat protein PrsT [Burkholderiaceae bacterium]
MKRPARLTRLAAALTLAIGMTACAESPDKILSKAKEAVEKKDFKAAEIHLKNFLQKEESAEARFLLGELYRRNGDLRAAERDLRRALELGFDPDRVAPTLADVLLQAGQHEKVLELSRTAATKSPQAKARLLSTTARAQLSLGRQNDAMTSYRAALDAAPDHLPAQVGILALGALRGDVAGAIAGADQILAKTPDSVDALSLKGELLAAQGKSADALETFSRLAAADPSHRNARARIFTLHLDAGNVEAAQKTLDELRKLTGNVPQVQFMQAQIDVRQRNFEKARDGLLAVLKSAPDFLPAVALASNVFLSLNNLDLAEKYARQLVEKAPKSTQGYNLLGAVLLRQNQPDKVLQALRPALDARPNDAQLYAIAGEAALKSGDVARSAQYFGEAARLDPKDPAKKTGLGLAKIAGGDASGGYQELQSASALDPKSVQADMMLAISHLRAKQYDKAMAAVDQMERKQPDNALAANLRGTVQLAKGDTAAARKSFETAVTRDPKLFAAASNLAALELQANKPDEAKRHLQALIERDPRNIEGMLALAKVMQRTGSDSAQVLDLLKKTRDTDRTSIPAVLALNAQYSAMDKVADAIPMLQEARTANPASLELLDALGTAYLRTDQKAQAMETFDKLLALKPDSAQLQFRMGELKLAQKDAAGAILHFRKAAELSPQAPEPRIALATAMMRDGKIADARAIAAQLQKDLPKSSAGLILEGDVLASENKLPEAVASYRKAFAIEATPFAGAKVHQALLRAGKDADAGAFVGDWLKSAPKDLGVRTYLGDLALSQRNWKEAATHFEAMLAVQPSNPIALNNLAWALHQQKDARALQIAERAYAVAPQQPAILDTYGVILTDQGQAARGIPILKQAVSLAPRNPELRLHLGAALAKSGDKAGAKSELERIVKEAAETPSGKAAKELLGSL